jgi:predicted polyphosphate/ATP-dependent NAD kinase
VPGLVGLIVNPVAGAGGRVGLHGTDGQERYAEAVRRGGAAASPPRAARALRRITLPAATRMLAAPGVMGGDLAAASGLEVTVLDMPLAGAATTGVSATDASATTGVSATDAATAGVSATGVSTTAADTAQAARLMAAAGVELLVFVGGDGTARDIAAAVPPGLPVVGVPAGVKMRSGVFGTSPEAAADIVSDFARGGGRPLAEAEILDAAADGMRSEFHGVVTVPGAGGRLAGAKSFTMTGSPAELDALCSATARDLAPGVLYLFGPGSTTAGVLRQLGLAGTALGVDAVRDGRLIGTDLSEQEITALMEQGGQTRLVLGVIGGQGFLLGRGNQQLGPVILSRLAPADLIIVATAAKLAALNPPRLLIDTGDEAAFSGLCGYHRVRTGPSRYMMMQVATAA